MARVRAINAAGGGSRIGGPTQAGSILRQRLQQIEKYGSPGQASAARQTAKGGGGGNILSKGLGGLLEGLNMPRKVIEATVESGIEGITGTPINKSWSENVRDPSYGFGKIVEASGGKNQNEWVKRGLGLTGDIVFDPFTYLSFGSGSALEGAGKTAGVTRMVTNLADEAAAKGAAVGGKSAAEWGEVLQRVSKGASRLSNDELRQVARASGEIAGEELSAKQIKNFGHGISARIPVKGGPSYLIPGTETIGRGVARAGETIGTGLSKTPVGRALGGSLFEAKQMLRSGDAETIKRGARILDSTARRKATASAAERELAVTLQGHLRDAKKAGIEGEALFDALGERGTINNLPGEAFTKLDPQQQKVVNNIGGWLDAIPGDTAEMAKHRGIGEQFIANATEEGRPYVPRIMSDEFRAMREGRRGTTFGAPRAMTGNARAGFEKAALDVGDEVVKGNEATKLIQPGEQLADGTVAPSLERQIQSHVDQVYGPEAVQWYERNAYKALPNYMRDVSQRTGQIHQINYLRAFGQADKYAEWLPTTMTGGEAGVSVRKVTKDLADSIDNLDKDIGAKTTALRDIEDQKDLLHQARLTGQMQQAEYETKLARLDQMSERAAEDMRVAEDTLRRATEHGKRMGRAADAAAERRSLLDDAVTSAKADLAAVDQEIADATQKLSTTPRGVTEKGALSFEDMGALAAKRDEALAKVRQAMTAHERVPMVMEQAANGRVVADEIRQVAEMGESFHPDTPFYGPANEVSVSMFRQPVEDLAPEQLAQLADRIEGSGMAAMKELSDLGQEFPATLDPKVLRSEMKGFQQQALDADVAMSNATTAEEFDVARTAYETAQQGMANRRSVLTILKAKGQVPTVQSVMDTATEAMQTVGATADALTGVDPAQQGAALIEAETKRMESTLNKVGFTLGADVAPADPGQFLATEVAPGFYQGADGVYRHVVPASDAHYAATADNLYQVLGFGQPKSVAFQGPGGWMHAQEMAEGVGTVGEVLTAGDQATIDAVADAYSNQALTDVFLGTANWGPDDLAVAKDGTLYRLNPADAANAPPDGSDIAGMVDRLFYGGSSTGYGKQGTGVFAWDNLLKNSNITPSEMSSRLGNQWRELVGMGAIQSLDPVSGFIDWRVMAAKTMGPGPEAKRVGEMMNQRFATMVRYMDDEFGADTLDYIDQVLADGPESGLHALLDPDSRVWAPTHKQAALPNPTEGGNSWYHGYEGGKPNPAAPFPVKDQLAKMDSMWVDFGWGPSTASDATVGATFAGREGGIIEGTMATTPDRVLAFGPGAHDMESLAAGAVEAGTHPAGPGYDMFTADVARRIHEARPDLIEAVANGLRNSDQYGQSADIMDLARSIQETGLGQGITMGYDDALELAGQHLVNEGGIAARFPYDEITQRLNQIPTDGFKEFAGQVGGSIWSARLRRSSAEMGAVYKDMLDTARASLARDGDVIMFWNMADSVDPFLHALPTNQVTYRTGGNAAEIAAQRTAYEAGKTVPNPAYRATEDALRDAQGKLPMANDALTSVQTQFAMADDDLAKAKAAANKAVGHRAVAAYERDVVRERLAAQQAEHWDQAAEAYAMRDQLRAQGLDQEAQIAHLEGKANELKASIATAKEFRDFNQAGLDKMAPFLAQTLQDGWKGFGFGYQAPADVVDVIANMTAKGANTSEGMRSFLSMFDHVNNWMKGWLTSSSGFQIRNVMGGMFNNWLADAEVIKSMRGMGNLLRKSYTTESKASLTAAERVQWDVINRLGIMRSGVFHEEFATGLEHASLNPLAGIRNPDKAFLLPYTTRKLGENVTEPMLRGSLAWDRLNKAVTSGRIVLEDGTRIAGWDQVTAANADRVTQAVMDSSLADQILADVSKYHFDYTDLSGFERNVAKRIIPFYTWTRKNVPLQLEAIFTDPGKAILRYQTVARNLQLGTDEENIVPSYFGEQQMTRLPWTSGGQQMYGTIDLPFKDLFRITDPGQMLANVNPLIKTPIEMWAGKQFFSDLPLTPKLVPMPKTWEIIPGFAQVLSATGQAQKGPDGKWYMRENAAYAVGQYLPALSQIRRLVPSEAKYQNRAMSTYASYLGGVQFRTNTPQDQENEVFRRADALSSTVNDLRNLGVIPSKSKRKPDLATQPTKGNTLVEDEAIAT
jgi:hypothetical protein